MENLFEIGQKVRWTVGKIESEGVVLDSREDMTTVITHKVAGRISNSEVEVVTEILKKI